MKECAGASEGARSTSEGVPSRRRRDMKEHKRRSGGAPRVNSWDEKVKGESEGRHEE